MAIFDLSWQFVTRELTARVSEENPAPAVVQAPERRKAVRSAPRRMTIPSDKNLTSPQDR
jgi:hypothetical protein